MNVKTIRLSNFELLRLISMFLIVLHHYGIHGVTNETGTSLQSVAAGILTSFGKSGVFIFVFIGSFFLIDKNFRCSRIINIISVTFFYSILFLILGLSFFKDDITVIKIIRSVFFIPLNYWFVTDYIFLLLLIPFLNLMIKKLSKRKFELLLFIGLVMLFIFPSIFSSASEYSNIDVFVFLYCLTVYLKTYDFPVNLNQYQLGILLFFLFFCMILSVYVLSLYPNVMKNLGMSTIFFTRANSILTLSFSVIAFILFKRWKLKYNPLVNFASKATLGIYLIHDNPIVRSILWRKVNNVQYQDFSHFIVAGLIISFVLFTVCLVAELLRIFFIDVMLNKLFLKIIPVKYREKVDSIFNE